MIPAIVLFAVTYILMISFGKYRPYIALVSGAIFAVTGMLPMDQIIDSRMGETAKIRNYGGYNLKGVKHSFYSAIGEEEGVAMKITGKRVVVVSCIEPESVYRLLPKDNKE